VGSRNDTDGREATPGLGGTSPTPVPGSARHAQPGSILYASWVNKMSLARARLDPASGLGWFGFRAVIWSARNRCESEKGVAGKEQRRVWTRDPRRRSAH
jgi:hypothetical protein